MGEATAWADYVLPDSTCFERWTVVGVAPTILTKCSGVRQPAVGSLDANMNYTPVLPNTKTLEDILIGLARAAGWPVGLDRAWDYWRQVITNMAVDGGGPGLDYVLARGGRFDGYEIRGDPAQAVMNGLGNRVVSPRHPSIASMYGRMTRSTRQMRP
ncbi:MAG TPA: hypothetical protein PKC49_08655 [Phycisphaerae bacterium]|nr:hypothetical protein [Phycisphaerae bacterium]